MKWLKTILAAVLTLLVALCATVAVAKPLDMPTVILVRHAEKADDKSSDPPLSAAGFARAEALAAALKDAGVTAILTSPLQRTILTAQPLATARRITPQVIALERGGIARHIEAVTAAIRRHGAGGVVLVVGHSNTVPAIVEALGGPSMPMLCESDYANLFVLTADAAGGVRVIRSRYGQVPAVATGPDCK